jgi:hypothetical protein
MERGPGEWQRINVLYECMYVIKYEKINANSGILPPNLKILTPLRVCSDLYEHTEHTCQELMCSLSKRVRIWCAPEHMHQFSYFSNVHFAYPHTLSICMRNGSEHWAYASGTDARKVRGWNLNILQEWLETLATM